MQQLQLLGDLSARKIMQPFRKIFNDFDLNGTETLTIDEVTNLIAKLRISVERKFIQFLLVMRENIV